MQKETKLDVDIIFFTNINSKWIIDLHIKCKTTKLLEDNIGENFNDLGYGNNFGDVPPKALSIKERLDRMNFIKIKNFCAVRDNARGMRRQASDWGKNCKRSI